MRSFNLSNWIFRFFIEWLVPKIALSAAVFAVARALFSIPEGVDIGPAATERIEGTISLISGWAFAGFLIVTAAAFSVALVRKTHAKGVDGTLASADKVFSYIAKVFLFVIGMMVAPFVIGLAATVETSGAWSPPVVWLCTVLFVIAVLSAAAHFTLFDEMEPHEAITFVADRSGGGRGGSFSYAVHGRVKELFAYVPYVLDVSEPVETRDGYCAVTVGFTMKASGFDPEQLGRLALFLSALEAEWHGSGYKFERLASPGLQGVLREPAAGRGPAPGA